VLGVLRSGRYVLGPNVEAFEHEVAEFLGVNFAVGLANGTDAISIGLRALGVEPGDEVIVPSFTFFATAEAVSNIGAVPVFADIEPREFAISAETVEHLIGPRTRALVPVHLFGHPVDADPLLELARKRGLAVLEDAAQAFGALYRGRRVGSLGDAATFSFFPSKNLGAMGEAGMLATNDPAVAEHAKLLRNHGSKQRYQNEVLGYNSKLDEIQAAVLRVKLPYVDGWNEQRRRVAKEYGGLLRDSAGIEVPHEPLEGSHVYHQFTLRLPPAQRQATQQRLDAAGIASAIFYERPIHRMPMYRAAVDLPETDRAAREVLSVPIWPELETQAIERIVRVLQG